MADQPNILVLLTDDHGQWAANCYGCSDIVSPTLDFIAQTGARMNRAFTPCPVCSPARSSFWTGSIPSAHGVHDHIAEQDVGEAHPGITGQTNLAMRLKEAGYRTGLSGKWHCGRAWEQYPGFDSWFALKTTQARFGQQIYFRNGERVELFGHQAPITTDVALEFLKEDPDSDVPFFLYVGYTDTHSPFAGEPERLVEHYRKNPIRSIAGESFAACHGAPKSPATDKLAGEALAQYGASVTQIDEQVGRLLGELESQGKLDNTLVIYTSDHGHNNGQYGIWTKGNGTTPVNFLDGSILVPCMLRWPGHIKPGKVHGEFVDHCDLHMTILDAAGVTQAPDDQALTHGRSYLPLLRAEQTAWRDMQFCEYGNSRMVRSETAKLIRRYPGPNGHFGDEFYDLTKDPRETCNLIDAPEAQEQIDRLSRKLDAFFAEYEVDERRGPDVALQYDLNTDEPWRRPLTPASEAVLRD